MAVINLRLPDDLADRFAAVAALEGGRAVLLRRLIGEAVDAASSGSSAGPQHRSAGRVTVRLSAPEFAALDREAAAMGLSRARWLAALARRCLLGKPTFARADALTLLTIQGELRRVGVNVNQIARALNTALMEGRVLDSELAWMRSLKAEIRDHIGGLREAFDGNLAYWDTL
ncbi:MAG: plasmid mobilization relaxosome protein MobC [Caulobacter sp.]|nr:plasmid mobilization relaxosome protein MobC [Caulobacter sp.]